MKVFQAAFLDFSSPEVARLAVEKQSMHLFKGILELRIAFWEKLTSADVEVNTVFCGESFDDEWMEDAYGDNRRGGGEIEPDMVIATVGMALRKTMPPGSAFGYEKILPAKVVLQSSLKAALDPLTPSGKRGKNKKSAKTEIQDGRD